MNHQGVADPAMVPAAERPDSRRVLTWRHPSWLVVHGLTLSMLGLAWVLDEQFFAVMDRWYNSPEPLNGELHQLILSMAMYGQGLGISLSILLILIMDSRNRGRALILGVALLASGLTCDLLKALCGRERPVNSQGVTVFHGPSKGIVASRNQSFPSGHTATAFALSYGLGQFYPQARPLVWILAYGVGVNRVITVRHFLTDVIAGAWLGYMIAASVFPLGWLWRLGNRMSNLLAPADGDRAPRWSWSMPTNLLRPRFASPLLLLLASLTVNFAGNGATPLWDRDEPRFATATREMADRNDWIVPTFNGELRPDKPILVYWLMGAAYAAFGAGPFAARFFSAVAGTLACLLTYLLGRSMFGKRVGLLAGWMLALSPMLIVESKLATVDALLLLCLTGSLYCAWRLIVRKGGWQTALAFWIAVSAGILTKGPVAVGAISACLLSFGLWRRDFSWLSQLRWKMGVAVIVLLVAPWCIAVHVATGGDFLRIALGHHVVRRSLTALEGHRGIPGFYVLSVFLLMAPWSWMLPWAVREHWDRLRSDPRLAFLVAWIVGPLLLFESVRTKLVHYFLPAYPALALLIASAVFGRFAGKPTGLRRLDLRLGRVLILAGGLGGIGAIAFALVTLPASILAPALVVVAVAAGGAIVSGRLVTQRRVDRAFVVLCSSTFAALVVAGASLAPAVGRQRLVFRVAERIGEIRKETPVALWLYRDPSLVFNVGATLPVVDTMRDEPMFPDSLALAQRHGRFVCPMTQEHFESMSGDLALSVRKIETLACWDPNGFKRREVHLVEVRPSDDLESILQVLATLRSRLPDLEELYLPLRDRFDHENANSERRYPLNPAFLPDRSNRIRR